MDTQYFNNHCSNGDISFSASFPSMLILMQQHVNSNVNFNEMLFINNKKKLVSVNKL